MNTQILIVVVSFFSVIMVQMKHHASYLHRTLSKGHSFNKLSFFDRYNKPTAIYLPVKALVLAFGISLGASAVVAAPPPGKILVIVSSESAIDLRDGKTYPTGYFLNELAVPVMALMDAGYEIVFANPKGNPPSMDVRSDTNDFFGKDQERYLAAKAFHDALTGLKKPQKISAVIDSGLSEFRAVFFPGGHAPMQDLLTDRDVKRVLAHFHEQKKPTALICHAPIALLAALPKASEFVKAMRAGDVATAKTLTKSWPYAGYKMTIFSTLEEKVAEKSQLGGEMLFYPESGLVAAGGELKTASEWSSNVVVDRELITGQNPFSDEAFVNALLASLAKNAKKK
jgi:putative intracellular protease/amidase